jgi:hypothetical protein
VPGAGREGAIVSNALRAPRGGVLSLHLATCSLEQPLLGCSRELIRCGARQALLGEA